MGEKQCPECKMMVDSEAKTCPHCRKKFKKPLSKKTVLITLAIAVPLIILSNLQNQQEQAGKDPLDTMRYACKEFVLKTLNDPDSAKLDDYHVWFAATQKDGTILVQPKGRAKNAFGAYVYGTWNCSVINDGTNIRLVSMKQIRP